MVKLFNDPDLNKIVEEESSTMKNHVENLNRISNDIKTLEAVLRKSALPDIQFDCQEGTLLWSDNRILFGNGSIHTRKPLIECKVAIRLRVFPYLKEFFQHCLNVVRK